jgi:hypothetical protein
MDGSFLLVTAVSPMYRPMKPPPVFLQSPRQGTRSDLPAIDIQIEKNKVRERCLELYPDKEQLYDMIYESRFQRLWEQFRAEG